MNLGTIRTRCANWCGDPDQTRFAGKYNDAINRAQEQFALDTKALWKDTTWVVASGTSTYALPADFMFEAAVRFNNSRLDPTSRRSLDEETAADWLSRTGSPSRFMIDPEEANKVVRLYPVPQSADAGLTLSMRYYPLPASVAADADVPLNSSALMAQFHLALAAYAGWIILLDETVTPELQAKRRELLQIYNDAVTKATDTFKNTASESWHLRGSRAMR